ncbi:MAG: hypothetical protein PVJ55_04950 [Anaerolineae bacterium]|jgi:hypothetical protein
MLRTLFGVFIVLHGLVHLWPFALSRKLVEYEPEMGWTGRSWLFTPIMGDPASRLLASVLYVLATAAFVASAVGLFANVSWWRRAIVASAVFSAAVILSFWDGSPELIVEKGLAGFLIDLGIILLVLVVKWPA